MIVFASFVWGLQREVRPGVRAECRVPYGLFGRSGVMGKSNVTRKREVVIVVANVGYT